MIFVLVCIMGIIIWASWLFNKYIVKGSMGMNKSRLMKVVDSIAVGQDRFILIMQLDTKYYLIGSANGSIQLLKELDDESIEKSLHSISENSMNAGNFADVVKKFLDEKKRG